METEVGKETTSQGSSSRFSADDVGVLKEALGISALANSIEALTQSLKAPNKRPASGQIPRAKRAQSFNANVQEGESFDPSASLLSDSEEEDEVDSTDETLKEFEFPSIYEDSESYGPKITEGLAKRLDECFTKKQLEDKFKELVENYKNSRELPVGMRTQGEPVFVARHFSSNEKKRLAFARNTKVYC